MEFKNDLVNVYLKMTALLHGNGIWLLGKWLTNLGEVTVVIVLVAHIFNGKQFGNFATARSVMWLG